MSFRWSEVWDRAYKISIGTREYKIAQFKHENLSILKPSFGLVESDNKTIPSDARVMSNLENEGFNKRGFTFTFDTTQGLESKSTDSEKSTLTLYNINDDLIKVINQENCIVIIEAGYQGSVDTVYTGDVVQAFSTREGADNVYTLTCGSNSFSAKNTYSSLSYDESMSEKDIIIDMIGKFPGVAPGVLGVEHLAFKRRTGGTVYIGQHSLSFDKLMSRNNLFYCYINGKITIAPLTISGDNYSIFARTNYTLPEDSLKNITDISIRQGKGSSSEESKKRKLRVNTFFIPIEIGQFITIPSSTYTKQYAGTYQVKTRRVVLDSMGNSWDVILDVESI